MLEDWNSQSPTLAPLWKPQTWTTNPNFGKYDIRPLNSQVFYMIEGKVTEVEISLKEINVFK